MFACYMQTNFVVILNVSYSFIIIFRSNLQVRVKPGESALAFYTAENKSATPITGVSTYNVTPMKVLVLKLKFFGCFSFLLTQ